MTHQEYQQAVGQTFSTEPGKGVLEYLVESILHWPAGRQDYTASEAALYHEGRRSVVLELLYIHNAKE